MGWVPKVSVHLHIEISSLDLFVDAPFFSATNEQTVARSVRCCRNDNISWAQQLQRRLVQRPDLVRQLRTSGEEPDLCFCNRWLKARGFDMMKAEAAIASHAAWRAHYITGGRIAEDEIQHELSAQKVFFQGLDMQGRPVVVIIARRHNMHVRDLAETERLICYTLDNCAAAADLAVNEFGKSLFIFDLSGISLKNLDIKSLKAIFQCLQQHYPERLGELYFLNAPMIFWGAWNVVSPFVDPITRAKIHFIGGSSAAERLLSVVPEHVLPVEYGGDAQLTTIQDAVQGLQSSTLRSHTCFRATIRKSPSDIERNRFFFLVAVRGHVMAVARAVIVAVHNTHKLLPIDKVRVALGRGGTLKRLPSAKEFQVVVEQVQVHLFGRVLYVLTTLPAGRVGVVVCRAAEKFGKILRWTFGRI